MLMNLFLWAVGWVAMGRILEALESRKDPGPKA